MLLTWKIKEQGHYLLYIRDFGGKVEQQLQTASSFMRMWPMHVEAEAIEWKIQGAKDVDLSCAIIHETNCQEVVDQLNTEKGSKTYIL